MADFVDIPEQSDPNETLTPDASIVSSFPLDKTSSSLVGYYFESASYNKNGGGTFKFKVQVLNITDSYGVAKVLRFTGFDANGNSINRDYNITNPTNPNGQYGSDKNYYAVTLLNGTGNAAAVFSKDGKLEFRPSDFKDTITLAVKKKSDTDITAQ